VGGILVEATSSAEGLESVVVGIGINVSVRPPDMPAEVAAALTCVEDEVGRPVDRLALAAAVLGRLGVWYHALAREGPEVVQAGEELKAHWRLTTRREQTADEYGILVRSLFAASGVDVGQIAGVALASVVPPLTSVVVTLSRQYLGHEPLVVEPGVKTGMPILYEPPSDVGADRIVNGVAALAAYGGPVIVVDFGTATTFDVVTKKGEYVGGVICPGVGISADALFQRAARLPRVDVRNPGPGR